MSKLLFGAIVAQARNKCGGIVFSKNAYGAFIRRKVSPGAAKTNASTKSTAAFAATSKNWAAKLSQAQRDAWTALAAAWPTTDVYGSTIHLTGIAIYIRVNRELKVLGLPQIATPPADQTTQDIGGITPTFTPGNPYHLSLTVTNTPGANYALVVCASAFLSPGKKAPKANKIAFVQAFAPGASGPFDFTDPWNAKYTNILPFGFIAVAAYSIGSVNGAAGPRYATLLPIT
jgi:hypothetical protein